MTAVRDLPFLTRSSGDDRLLGTPVSRRENRQSRERVGSTCPSPWGADVRAVAPFREDFHLLKVWIRESRSGVRDIGERPLRLDSGLSQRPLQSTWMSGVGRSETAAASAGTAAIRLWTKPLAR